MITLNDIGVEPDAAPTDKTGVDEAAELPETGLVPGSPFAKALYRAWRGDPVVIVDSPPGAGKTTLVVNLAAELRERAGLKVVVATPTNRGGSDIADRIAESSGAEGTVVTGGRSMKPTQGVRYVRPMDMYKQENNPVVVRTIASCSLQPPECDVLIVDEAYQSTFADVAAAATMTEQVVMVGDPGQIGPVVSVDTRLWDGRKYAPHHRAPEVFVDHPEAVTLQIDGSYRLGQDTIDAISPLYDFKFRSLCDQRTVGDHAEVERLELPNFDQTDGLDVLRTLADTAASFIGQTITVTRPDGQTESAEAGQSDIAVVAAHNSQVNAISSMLAAVELDGIYVGTADKMQGGQWDIVIALDPFTGIEELSPHHLSLGRLCVMASRHATHLTWAYSTGWRDALDQALPKPARQDATKATHIDVRQRLGVK